MADVVDNESTSSGEQLPVTRSRFIAESVTWTLFPGAISNYEDTIKNMDGQYIKSTTLRFGGYDWEIRLWPNGTRGLYASAYLNCAVRGKGVRAKFALNVLDASHKQVTYSDEIDVIFSPKTNQWGYDKFVRKNQLEFLSYYGDTFTICCDLTVIKDSPPLELPGQLERILGDGTGADVTFHVAGEMFRAHRFMLAASSPVFYGQLFGPMKEKDMNRVDVPDIEPHIFEMLLQFIYTGSVPTSDDDECHDAAVMQHLLVAADRYGMEKLKLTCEEKLGKMIDLQTVTTTLVLADQHQFEGLKDACIEFMSSPGVLDDVKATEGFEHLVKTCPHLALEENFKDKLSVSDDSADDHNDWTATSCYVRNLEITRCITESVTATFDYKVTYYPELKDVCDDDGYISSPIFRVGGHNWIIKFYPNKEETKNRANTSVYLHCLSENEDVITAKFGLYLVQKEDQIQEGNFNDIYGTFSGHGGYGHHKFASKNKLKSLSRIGDGCFTIRCVLTVLESSPLPEVHGNLEHILRDGGGTDVTFIVGGQPFRAHRAFLVVRSPIFEAQLFDPATQKDIECVDVADMEPAIFEMLLYFVYTDLLPPCSNNEGHDVLVLQRLLGAADRYGLDRLKMMCEDELCKKIDVETVAATFAVADRHHCQQLRSECLDFMASPEVLDTILANNGFKNMHLGTP